MSSNMQFPLQSFQLNQGSTHGGPSLHASSLPPPALLNTNPLSQQQSHSQINQASSGVVSGGNGHQHAQQQTPQQQQQQQQQQFQRLKVEDALSYLDQVKLQFGNQPQVYNDFLDIMKEFKSQTIDTPGVINRVSNLFRGHADLIVGFNTFLPPGYKIEVNANDLVQVHQPGGQATLSLQIGPPIVRSTSPDTSPMNQASSLSVASTVSSLATHHSFHTSSLSTPSEPVNTQQHNNNQSQPASQPVEFNHAINYVNKIKNRFQGQPDIYKAFLEILHTYQKEQRNLKESGQSTHGKPLTESEVYSQVAKLFQNQEDLLSEFGQFLPDANGSVGVPGINYFGSLSASSADPPVNLRTENASIKKNGFNKQIPNNKTNPMKRTSNSGPGLQTMKKAKMTSLKDVSLAEASKYGSLSDYAFFDKVRKALKNQDVYDNFLRCLILFSHEVISRVELVQLINPFLSKQPELLKSFKEFLGYKETGITEAVPQTAAAKDRLSGDLAMEIDFASCKKYGASYRALPKSYVQPKCSGRTQLCREVLNDTWVSFPSWSEDSTFVTSRKTQYEEHIYRCEDERFELDNVIECNLSTVRILEAVQKKLQRMSSEEAAKFKLDNSLGGTSESIHKKAIQRIYGDKAPDIIDGLKKNPVVAVPLVLRRLKAKDDEWREAQRHFNKIWREQNEKYYLKSLDHQGLNFKANDMKTIRSKALLNEIETIFDERQEQAGEIPSETGPHLVYSFKDRSIFDDASALIIHHMKRQTSIHKDDKQLIKQLMYHFIPDLFFNARGELSDDEGDVDPDDESEDENTDKKPPIADFKITEKKAPVEPAEIIVKEEKPEIKEEPEDNLSTSTAEILSELKDVKIENECGDDEDKYSLFFAHNTWYLFFRLHHILCDRLLKIYTRSRKIAEDESKCKVDRKESTAISLRLKKPSDISPDHFYPHFLEMVKNLLDGNQESSTYEDTLREMFGIHAFIGFTMDKVIQNIVKQLQNLVSDELCVQVKSMFDEELLNEGTGGLVSMSHQNVGPEQAYQRKAEQLLTEENCFKIKTFRKDCILTIELLDTENEGSEEAAEIEKWSEYIEKFVAIDIDDPINRSLVKQLSYQPVFLARNALHSPEYIKKMLLQAHELLESDDLKEHIESKEKSSNEESEEDIKNIDNNHTLKNIAVIDNTECKFTYNSEKMLYVMNSGSYLYKKNTLSRAREGHKSLSLHKHSKFKQFLDKWIRENVSEEQSEECLDWLLGEVEEIKSSKTYLKDIQAEIVPPYYTYTLYKVKKSNTVLEPSFEVSKILSGMKVGF